MNGVGALIALEQEESPSTRGLLARALTTSVRAHRRRNWMASTYPCCRAALEDANAQRGSSNLARPIANLPISGGRGFCHPTSKEGSVKLLLQTHVKSSLFSIWPKIEKNTRVAAFCGGLGVSLGKIFTPMGCIVFLSTILPHLGEGIHLCCCVKRLKWPWALKYEINAWFEICRCILY